MRFFDLSTTVLAAAVAMSGAVADAQAAYSDSVTSATTTYYITRTVLRVETTVTATLNGSASTYESSASSTVVASASGIIPSYGNGTSSVYGTGAIPSSTYTPAVATGAASKLQTFGFAALAGFAGLLVV